VENVVAYVYTKFGNDGLWNEKALADRKSDNNNTKNNNNNVGGAWRPVSGSKNKLHCMMTILGLYHHHHAQPPPTSQQQ